jgi:hypothetical protein
VSYAATDAGSGVQSYDVRYRTAGPTTAFKPYVSLFNFRTLATARAYISAGTTICWSVRARDHAGNISAWTPDHCTTRAVDDRSLKAKTSGWTRITSKAFLSGTATRARKTGAQLASAKWSRGRVRVVVTECSTCGAIRVYAGAKYLGKLSTHASKTRNRVVLSLSVASAGGPIRLVAATSAQVIVDAVGLLRY